MNRPVRVRFAPSPTGSLHIGGVRTALYNLLFARQQGGTFILRIEDTDQNRFVPGAEEYITGSLQWLGLEPDESPQKGGPYGPYRQSERSELYARHARLLIETGHAYLAFDTPEELEAARKSMPEGTFQYNAATRMALRNSLSLPSSEVQALLDAGTPHVVRLKVPKKEEIRFEDVVRGWVMVHSSTLDDKVLLKSDGLPTYHLANVVDDYHMKISHVIRGEEWLPSAPTHVLLYRCFGWEEQMPVFAHLPLLLKPNGEGKLSKRDGEVLGFPVFPLAWTDAATGRTVAGFREEGYLPGALLNFLAFLGWNPGTEQELFSVEELIPAFSLARISKSGARFDIQKARWYNHHYLQQQPLSYFTASLRPLLETFGLSGGEACETDWVNLLKERSHFLSEMEMEWRQLMEMPATYDPELVAAKWNPEARKGLEAFTLSLTSPPEWTGEGIKSRFNETVEEAGIKPGKVFQMLRLAVTGKGAGPDLMTLMRLLGPERCHERLSKALNSLP